MTSTLIDFGEYILTDTGEVVALYKTLFERLRRDQSIAGLWAQPHPSVTEFNRWNPQKPIKLVTIDGKTGEFPARLFDFKIPQKYRDIDLDYHIATKILQLPAGHRAHDNMDEYCSRAANETYQMRERGMEDFLRLLIYIVEVFNDNDVVYGIGRGSGCASLVLYLCGVHFVDPLEYDIPISEFLR